MCSDSSTDSKTRAGWSFLSLDALLCVVQLYPRMCWVVAEPVNENTSSCFLLHNNFSYCLTAFSLLLSDVPRPSLQKFDFVAQSFRTYDTYAGLWEGHKKKNPVNFGRWASSCPGAPARGRGYLKSAVSGSRQGLNVSYISVHRPPPPPSPSSDPIPQ